MFLLDVVPYMIFSRCFNYSHLSFYIDKYNTLCALFWGWGRFRIRHKEVNFLWNLPDQLPPVRLLNEHFIGLLPG